MEKKIYDENMLSTELKELETEINVIEDLYDEVKDHLDNIKSKPFKGSMVFIEKQTTNLINIKNAKLNLIKEKINIKKTLTDFAFKEENLKKNDDENTYDYKAVLDTILAEMNAKKNNDTIEDNDIDAELDKVSEDMDVDSIVGDDAESVKKTNYSDEEIIAVDSKGNFYKINSDYEILEELEHIEDITDKVILNDMEYGIGSSGNTYLIINIETEN
jgi:hypothetical protein